MGQKKQRVIVTVLIIAVAAAICLIGVLLWQINRPKETGTEVGMNGNKYEASVILDDPVTLQDKVNEMIEKAAEGNIALKMQVTASSADGENFSCLLANSEANSYDSYLVLYLDETQEEIYRTGLIPVGGRIETFTTTRKLSPGSHSCTLVFNQVEEDGETLHSQVNVGLDLIVSEQAVK